MKLVIGTAQFGAVYGAFNACGQISLAEVENILARGCAAGIRVLDTARAYGVSETVLAQAGAPSRFSIVTKCPALGSATDPAAAVAAAFEASCAALGVSDIYGYLLHNSQDLMRPGVWSVLEALMRDGRVARVGVSGYEVAEVAILCTHYPINLVQLPGNVLDPWFLQSPLPDGVDLHVRSAFLQGFLLADPERLPARFQPWREILVAFRTNAAAHGLTPIQAALAPLLTCPRITQVVVGVDSLNQLGEILDAAIVAETHQNLSLAPLPNVSKSLTDPRRWKG